MSEPKIRPQVQEEPRCVVVDWAHPDHPERPAALVGLMPVSFGPFEKPEQAQAFVDYIMRCQESDDDPPEKRVVCRIGTHMDPSHVRRLMFP